MAHEESTSRRVSRERTTSSSGGWAVKRRRLTGSLDVGSAHRALELLSENSLYGSLTVTDGLSDISFFFTRGGLRVVAAGRELPSLRARMQQLQLLDAADVKKVEHHLAKLKKDTSKVKDQGVLERGVLIENLRLKPNEVDDAAREVIAEIFLDCLFWEDPQYEAVTGEPDLESMQRSDLSALTLSLGVQDLVERLQQKIRTISDVRKTVSSLRVQVQATPHGREVAESRKRLGEGSIGERRTKLLRIASKEQGLTAEDLRQRLGSGELETASLLHELVVEGYVELRRGSPDKKAELERLRKMEEGIDQAISQLLRRMRLADDSAKVGETGKAARHMARAGGLLLGEGRADEAARAFSGALKHSDDDLEAREGYVQSLWGIGRASEALEQSDELGRRYLELNLPGRAKNVLEKALGREERTGTLELLVSSLIKLRQPRAATEAGERLVNRLRREGRRDEARATAGKLLALSGDPNDRARLLKALGVDRRRSVVLSVSLGALCLLLIPAQARLGAREAYAEQVTLAGRTLKGDGKDPERVAGVLSELHQSFAQLEERGGEVGQLAHDVAAQLKVLRHDQELYQQRVGSQLPWQPEPDALMVMEALERLKSDAKTPALQAPLTRLVEAILSHAAAATRARRSLQESSPGPKSHAAAQAFQRDFPNLPGELDQARLRILVVSEPPGADVDWGGISYTNKTPLELSMPLLGETHLRISMQGYEPVQRAVSFEDLNDDSQLSVSLQPARFLRDPVRRPSPRQTPTPTPTARRTPTPRPSTTPSQPARQSRIQVVEGHLGGADSGRFRFSGGDEKRFARHTLPRTYRCDVVPLHEIDGRRVYMTGVRVIIQVRRRKRWVYQRAYDHELGDRYLRGLLALPGGVIEIQPLARTLHLDKEWFSDEVQEAIDDAVYAYKRRRDR